jgi:DNA-binding response OmpR family regulator
MSGREALVKIKNIPRPDMIISDIMMDDMDGYELYDRLLEDDDYQAIPLIFMTALTSLTDKLKGLEKGAIDYIYKPFHFEELRRKIHSIIKIRDALAKENILKLSE